ncbi:MAG: hypothetical protein FD547_000324 [Pelagibacterales bacterium]|nr:hypothetical protein [Pelagibacterales bacterium]
MPDSIDIKLFKKPEIVEKKVDREDHQVFEKDMVYKIYSSKSNFILNNWVKFQQQWCNSAYAAFKDYDTYLILIYLINRVWKSYSERLICFSLNDFYSAKEVIVEKISLVEISKTLSIPKESIRRKINELEKKNILYRKKRKIYLNVDRCGVQKPINSIKSISVFLSKSADILEKEEWFGKKPETEHIEKFITKYFTKCWKDFLDLQILYLVRHRKMFGDIETWHVWGSIAASQFTDYHKDIKKSVISKPDDYHNLLDRIYEYKPKHGINASSISDISGIPRATVMRKMKNLVKLKFIKKNKRNECLLRSEKETIKLIKKNYITTQKNISIFVSSIFNLIKNSNLKL